MARGCRKGGGGSEEGEKGRNRERVDNFLEKRPPPDRRSYWRKKRLIGYSGRAKGERPARNCLGGTTRIRKKRTREKKSERSGRDCKTRGLWSKGKKLGIVGVRKRGRG